MVAITGTDIVGGTVTPTATAVNSFYVTTSGNTAYASTNAVSGNNCSTSSSNCNAIFNFSAPVVSITITYANNTQSAFGNPPNQAIGVSFGGYCLQNGQLLNLAKTWVNAVTGHTAAATTSSNRVATAALPAANATFSSTAPSTGVTGAQIRVFQGETITLPTETFGGGATAAMYTTTLQCTGGTPLSLGSAARSIVINSDSTNTVCTYTNTMGSADLKISKSTTAVVALNGTLTYKITVSNMGPATVTGATLKDPVATGITKTSVACDSSLATNKCTTAPSITALEGAGYALPALAASIAALSASIFVWNAMFWIVPIISLMLLVLSLSSSTFIPSSSNVFTTLPELTSSSLTAFLHLSLLADVLLTASLDKKPVMPCFT